MKFSFAKPHPPTYHHRVNWIKQHLILNRFRVSPIEKIVLIMSQKYKGSERLEKEVIDRIRKISGTVPIIYKKHPRQTLSKLGFLKEHDRIILIEKVFPAELLISELKNSLILSAFSTSFFYRNSTCNYFWLYPLNAEESNQSGKVDIAKPKEHIRLIQSFDEFDQSMVRHLPKSNGMFNKAEFEQATL